MPDLAEFLLARIAEDEAVARAAGGGSWIAHEDMYEEYDWAVGARWEVDGRSGIGRDVVTDEAPARHIARYDPARVLAECEAKRRIVEQHLPAEPYCAWTNIGPSQHLEHDLCDTLRLLALPYADAADYHPEWRP